MTGGREQRQERTTDGDEGLERRYFQDRNVFPAEVLVCG